MEKEICYKNHDKIVKIYKKLEGKKGKQEFEKYVKFLNKPETKKAVRYIIYLEWISYYMLLNTIKKHCLRISKKGLLNKDMKAYIKKICHDLNRIKSPDDMYKFVYKVLKNRNLYEYTLQFYKILSDKSKCVKLLR